MQSRSNKNLKGIDISKWKENINFNRVKAAGYSVVIIKATEGVDYIDNMFIKHYKGAKAAGLNIGFYHFMSDKTDPTQQARDFYAAIKDKDYNIIPSLDIERETRGRNRNEVTDRCLEFLREFKRLSGIDCIIYTYTSFAKEKLDSRLKNYPLWIAHYGVNTPGNNGIWNSWVGFQYSESKSIPGVAGGTDADEFTNDIFLKNAKVVKVPSTSCNSGTALWEREISGEEVKALQRELNRQFNKGLKVDGYFGDSTLAACITVREGAKGNITRLIQQRLLNRGYTSLNSHGGADGCFGAGTTTAIEHLQANKGIGVDGIVGRNTWKALYSK